MTEAWPIERDHAMVLRKPIDEAARVEIVERHGVPVQQHDGWAFPPINVVQANPVDLREKALGWMLAFGAASLLIGPRCGRSGGGNCDAGQCAA
ncbi:hypothetical protein [Variovorax rhizosphaerae]|uniref:Uncharacterized protein n=1 Tax=Variovorax rhizosphaerae TaxID=1836200 RepID=A0ABU8X0E9_9BURK